MISQGVKEEVTTAIKPMQERQRHLEGVQSEMIKEFKEVIEEVKEIKNSINNIRADQFSSLPNQSLQPVQNPMPLRPNYSPALRDILHTGGHMTDRVSPQQGIGRCQDPGEED